MNIVFACYEKACAPPPAGRGGSSSSFFSKKGKGVTISGVRLTKGKKGSGVIHTTGGKVKVNKYKDAKNALGLRAWSHAFTTSTIVFACHSKACAPPPTGTGGSSKGKGFDKVSISGARGKEATYKGQSVTVGKSRMIEKGGGKGNQTMVEVTDSTGKTFEVNMRSLSQRARTFPEIGAEGKRGDSKPVSSAEFQRLAGIGQDKLDQYAANATPIRGLDDKWSYVKSSSYKEATQSWGGATVDAHTGVALPQGANKYALTIKDKGVETVSIPEGASKAEFDAAMDVAKERFRPILEREGSHLGVFHDDDLKRIDIDPVLVVSSLDDVHTIGAATRAIGGAYNFADGNGYWPPHVEEGS